ncbi:NACHT, LRR and PYD domains-containing protein 12-like [Salarias fasciatus]|uniref:NACHT, LRR and PYD domains-containing protein 12-like n=1 Tax=Salarias fasciatus TaxID=181472 RepID=UPI001176E69B|nr:NACHT, LRR and PYD domains-containing protein 12-like [Salarias fasciatus]
MDRENMMKEVKDRLKSHLRYNFTWINEGTSDGRSRLDHIYTRLYITDQAPGGDFRSHEILDHFKVSDQTGRITGHYDQIDCLDIFTTGRKSFQLPVRDGPIRTVMTKGIAGIGKTFAVQFFALNWAEGKSNQDIDLIFLLPFRELNMLKQGDYSLMQLLLHFYPQLSPLENTPHLTSVHILVILDGLDESRFPLDFEGGGRVSDIDQKCAVDVLLTSLIRGSLLPNARLWITSRPAAVGQVPAHCIDQMTEVQGFTDQDKEIYFRKRFSDSTEVLSYLKGMVSFYFMGHIPIFCWILAEVLKNGDERSRTIRTMTELYIHYLLIQTRRSEQKYGEKNSKNEAKEGLSRSQNADMLLNLSRLAFEQLQKGNILFYEKDLQECGIDIDEASVFCGFCSEILKQERGLYQQRMFSFVHLSFQEFLAALHVFHCRATDRSTLTSFLGEDIADLSWLELQKKVVNKALQNKKGQFDLFLCFFLGLSLESNQTMLQALLPETKSSTDTSEDMKTYLRSFHTGNIPAERFMNLFLCKFELKEAQFQEEIPKYLNAGARLSTVDCAVLSTMLQISGEVIEELNLTNCFSTSEGLSRLLLNVKNSKKALMRYGDLRDGDLAFISTLQSADSLLRDLTSKQSPLRVLDLNNCRYSYQHEADNPMTHSEDSLSKKSKTMESREDIDDELTLLTLIPTALIGPVCQLEEFRMPGCCLRSRCCQVFASALCSDSQLKELDLSRNLLQDLGAQLLSAGLGRSKCKLLILRLSSCGITEEGCTSLASALKSNPSHLRELDLSYNYPGELGVRLLSERLQNPECRLEKLKLSSCGITEEGCTSLASALKSNPSHLRELDLSCNYPGELGVRLLSERLQNPECRLEKLKMPGCCLRSRCCQVFASALCSDSQLKELDLSRNPLQDLGAQLLSAGLGSSRCKLLILRLSSCGITEEGCTSLASALKSNPSHLRELDLSCNYLGELGVRLLSERLQNPKCRLEKLKLSSCGITEEGCTSLASALKSNPSHLRELDLSYNYPGELGVRLLSERLQNPECRLEKLNVDHNEEHWVNTQLLAQCKYHCMSAMTETTRENRKSLGHL